ncbi:glycosyltransferase family 4 protein [Deferrisoma camini]|uniref:glycosyltransferase family 4 protein n=1 Tax=Deferrisoma camini TaxID=1035120 RepID=UPI00046D0C63|nr:glycosyltransferase family 4 protein [Deferrisoma camini]
MRVLIVAAEFPPYIGIGRLRPLKMCQHLPDFGWETAVLTVNEASVFPRDPATLREIPDGVPVHRACRPRPLESLLALISQRKAHAGEAMISSEGPQGQKARGTQAGATKGEIRRLAGAAKKRWDLFARAHLLVPDGWALWIFPAVRKALKVVREWGPDVIFSTAPPFSGFLVGWAVKRRTGLPWVVDYRDLWTGDVLREWLPPWRKRFELWLERRLVGQADAVIAVSKPKEDVLRARLRSVPADRFFTITNGFDPEEYDGVEPELGEPGAVRVVYTGRLFKNRRGYEVVEAAAQLFDELPAARSRLRFEYYGGVAPEIAETMNRTVERHGVRETFRFFPAVPYQRSKALQKGADALLMIVDTGETTAGVLPGKLFEYIAARRPVLCIAADGAAAEIVRKGGLGWVVPPGDVAGLKNVLKRLLNGEAHCHRDDEYLAGFERRTLIGQMAEVLMHVAT